MPEPKRPVDMPGGRGARIGAARRAPLAHVFDLDRVIESLARMRGGHEFPLDVLKPIVGGVPGHNVGALGLAFKALAASNLKDAHLARKKDRRP